MLDALYTMCVVISPDVASCRQRSPILLTSSSGYLSSYVTEQTGCGGVDSPWRIRAAPGQRINVSLFDFGLGLGEPSGVTKAVAGLGAGAGLGVEHARSKDVAFSTACLVGLQLLLAFSYNVRL